MPYPLLDNICAPSDVKNLSFTELEQLAEQLRQRIIEVMSLNGGHLASSLGAVEFTIALHFCFNSPTDKFLWDVGHQTYPHKLLTGRHKQFDSVRKTHGLCGFTHPEESEHDHFHAGHAGTALGLGLGVAKNRDLTGRDEYIVSVIGDATLTCGMSLEALNNISRDLKNFVIVLNDNQMSISKNVGQITHILSRMINNPTTAKMHQELYHLVSKIPGAGHFLSEQGHKLAESIKNLVSPAAFFEHFGLSYIGPIDGHDLRSVIDTFQRIKNSNWPTIVHMVTNKGQGLDVAVDDPVKWHGAKPFDVQSCKFFPGKNPKPTFPKVFGKHMVEMADKDPSLVAVTPAMSAGSCLDEMRKRFPDRCIDVGIAESHAVTFCGGIAYGKRMKVICSIYSTFLQRGFDNLFLDVCLQELPVVFAIDRAGIAGGDGATHNGIYDIAWLNAMPNMVICQPRNGHVLKELLESAHSWGQPVAIRYPNIATETPDIPIQKRSLGKGEVLQDGKDLLIFGLGSMCDTALKVAKELKKEGVDATVVDPVFVKPLDTDLICRLLTTHNKIVTIEEHSQQSGFGSIVNHFFLSHGYQGVQVLNCGIPETFVHHGSRDDLLKEHHLDTPHILQKIQSHFQFTSEKKTLPATPSTL